MAKILKGEYGPEALRTREPEPEHEAGRKALSRFRQSMPLVWLEQRGEIMKIKKIPVGKISWDPVVEDFNFSRQQGAISIEHNGDMI